MGSFKSAPLSALLLFVLLGAIVAILIAPQIDLPDTAFQRNSSRLAVHAQPHKVSQVTAVGNARHIGFSSADTLFLALNDRYPDRLATTQSAHSLVLRC